MANLAQILLPLLGLAAVVGCQGLFEDRPPGEPCDGVECSGHGECVLVDEGSRAACVCDDGFEDEGLECVPIGADADADSDADTDSDVDADSDDERCIPDCLERECGSDDCSGMCPPGCAVGQICDEETGHCECWPNCGGRECGSDSCGGSCPPGCPADRWCDDGACSVFCAENLGWGNACSGMGNCDDDSICQSYPALEDHGSFCSPRCSSDDLCPDISSGREICSWGFCLIECVSSSDCPCDMECRDLMGVQMICYP